MRAIQIENSEMESEPEMNSTKVNKDMAVTQVLPPQPKKGSRLRLFGTLFVGFLIMAGVGAWFWINAQGHEETDDAYVDGHLSVVSSRISGNVTKVLVEDNQNVAANQVLVTLDPRDYNIEVQQLEHSLESKRHSAAAAQAKIGQSSLSAVGQSAQAEGDVNATKADVETARAALFQAMAQVKQSRSKIKELEAAVQFAKSDFSRYEFAYQNKAVTKQQYDRAQQNIDMAEAQLQQGHDSLLQSLKQEAQAKSSILQAEGKLQKSHGTVTTAVAAGKQSLIDKEEFASAQSELLRQQAMLDKAKLNLSYCQIVAPVAGRVGKKSVEIGQRIEPGQALMSIVQPDMWVSANFKETQMSKMKKGQRAEVKIDAFPDVAFKGYVDSFSPASGAKFSILPPDNASGNFTKVVQRIPVKIVFDQKEAAAFSDRLAPGMSCVVTVFFK